jgi:hypothetical protein
MVGGARPHSAVGVELTLELQVELRPGGSDAQPLAMAFIPRRAYHYGIRPS